MLLVLFDLVLEVFGLFVKMAVLLLAQGELLLQELALVKQGG